jgi:hypothetical protein
MHRSAARLGEAQTRMSEPHILKLPRSLGSTAQTKGGSMPRFDASAFAVANGLIFARS